MSQNGTDLNKDKYSIFYSFSKWHADSFGMPFLVLLGFVVFSIRCSFIPEKVDTQPAFYHWKTVFNPTDFERDYMQQLGVDKVYMKFFDVDIEEGQPIPKAVVQIESDLATQLEIVPTIFITNRTFKGNINIEELGEKIANKIITIIEKNDLLVKEIQFDCDWSDSTRAIYFEFLKSIRFHHFEDYKVSATIRLHQIKYQERTGVPPVDKGVLMYYNMGDLNNWETENSILDNNLGLQYLKDRNGYPLPLNIALPIYDWGVVYRDGVLVRLINQMQLKDLADTTRFEVLAPTRFRVKNSTYQNSHYLYQNDLIRVEQTDSINLKNTTKVLNVFFKKADREIIFYHLDSLNLSKFPVEKIKAIADEME